MPDIMARSVNLWTNVLQVCQMRRMCWCLTCTEHGVKAIEWSDDMREWGDEKTQRYHTACWQDPKKTPYVIGEKCKLWMGLKALDLVSRGYWRIISHRIESKNVSKKSNWDAFSSSFLLLHNSLLIVHILPAALHSAFSCFFFDNWMQMFCCYVLASSDVDGLIMYFQSTETSEMLRVNSWFLHLHSTIRVNIPCINTHPISDLKINGKRPHCTT